MLASSMSDCVSRFLALVCLSKDHRRYVVFGLRRGKQMRKVFVTGICE